MVSKIERLYYDYTFYHVICKTPSFQLFSVLCSVRHQIRPIRTRCFDQLFTYIHRSGQVTTWSIDKIGVSLCQSLNRSNRSGNSCIGILTPTGIVTTPALSTTRVVNLNLCKNSTIVSSTKQNSRLLL